MVSAHALDRVLLQERAAPIDRTRPIDDVPGARDEIGLQCGCAPQRRLEPRIISMYVAEHGQSPDQHRRRAYIVTSPLPRAIGHRAPDEPRRLDSGVPDLGEIRPARVIGRRHREDELDEAEDDGEVVAQRVDRRRIEGGGVP